MARCVHISLLLLFASVYPGTASPAGAQTSAAVSAEALLSDRTVVVSGNHSAPIEYQVDLGVSFTHISEVTFSFAFSGAEPLNPGECVEIEGGYPGASGVCGVQPEGETERILTIPCDTFPEVCEAYLDGIDDGTISVSGGRTNPNGRPVGHSAVTFESFTVTVEGVPSL